MRWMSLAKQAPRCWRRVRTWRASGLRACWRRGSSIGLLGEGVGEPVGGLADVEGDGGGVGGDDATGGAAVGCGPGGVGGDAAPAYGSGEAEVVEPAGVVVGYAGGEEGALPLDGRGLEAFELVEGFEDAFFAAELGLRGEVLPGAEPAEVDGGGDGFDLLAEGAEGEAVDALEDAAFAPFDVVVLICGGVFEGSAHEGALYLHGEEGLIYRRRDRQA